MFSDQTEEWLSKGWLVAAELSCPDQNYREWVGIHPYRLEQSEYPPQKALEEYPLRYKIIRFRVARTFDFDKYDLHHEYVDYLSESKATTVDAVLEVIIDWGIDPKILTDPSKCDYPK